MIQNMQKIEKEIPCLLPVPGVSPWGQSVWLIIWVLV